MLNPIYSLGSAKKVMATFVVMAMLSGCSLDTDSDVTQKRVALHQGAQQVSVEAETLTEDYALSLAKHYERFGTGPVRISVAYDPGSRANTAMNAADHAGRIVGMLAKKGIKNVESDIVPISSLGAEARVLIDYNTVTAHAPEGCSMMSGSEGRDTQIDMDYEYGCSIETLLARQIHRPQDLAGNDQRADAYGRRGASTVVNYVFGIRNPPLSGETVAE